MNALVVTRKYGWFSEQMAKSAGSHNYGTPDGGTVEVTNVTESPTDSGLSWPDVHFVGEVTEWQSELRPAVRRPYVPSTLREPDWDAFRRFLQEHPEFAVDHHLLGDPPPPPGPLVANVDDLFAALVAEPKKLYALVERLERVAGPWKPTGGYLWNRYSLFDWGDNVFQVWQDKSMWRVGGSKLTARAFPTAEEAMASTSTFPTAEEAKAAVDAALVAEGWTLLGPADPEGVTP